MRIRLLAVCAILPAVAEGADPLPFKILDYRITGPSEILLHTNGSVVSIRGAAMDIALKGAADPVMTAPMAADGSRDVILRLPQNLTKSQSYELRLRSDAASSVTVGPDTRSGPFAADPFPISTKAAATIEPDYSAENLGIWFNVKSKIKLQALDPAKSFRLLDYTGQSKKELATERFELLQDTPTTIGWVRIVLKDGLTQQQARLQVRGMTNIFGDVVETDTAPITLVPLPKDKTDATVYLKFQHQGGTGLPAWNLTTRLAPLLGQSFWGGWRALPSFDADIGNRTVGTTKTNDVIKPAFGLTRLFRYNAVIEGVRLTPAISYETNRKGTTGNLLADLGAQFIIGRVYRPMAYAQRAKWIDAVNTARAKQAAGQTAITDIKLDEVSVLWGWGFQFFMGAELGGALNERKVQASKGSAGSADYQVELPKFGVARMRPKVRGFLEIWRMTLDTTVTPRYLGTREYYSFESPDSKHVFLGDLQGWASYLESSFSCRLDAYGHVAVNATWKHGIVPPSYIRTNTVQSGLEFKF
jgi:hypothetical protein